MAEMKQTRTVIIREANLDRVADSFHNAAQTLKRRGLFEGRVPEKAISKMAGLSVSLGLKPEVAREKRAVALADAAMFYDAKGDPITTAALFNMASQVTKDLSIKLSYLAIRDALMDSHQIPRTRVDETMGRVLERAGYTVKTDTVSGISAWDIRKIGPKVHSGYQTLGFDI